MTEPAWTSINDAVTRTGKSKPTIYRLISRDQIPTSVLAGVTLVAMVPLRASIARTVRGRPRKMLLNILENPDTVPS